MEIYRKKPEDVLRVSICKQKEKSCYLSVSGISQQDFYDWAKEAISKIKVDPFSSGVKTSLNIREAVGGKNGKTLVLSFIGMSAQGTRDYLERLIESKESQNLETTILFHTISYWYDNKMEMTEDDIEHVRKLIIDGYNQGELCGILDDDSQVPGWWSIKFN